MLSVCLLAHANPLYSVFSNPSSFQNSQLLVFGSRGLFDTGPVQMLLLPLGSPCPLSRYHKGVNFGSSNVGEQDTLLLAVPLPRPLSPRQYSAHDNIPQFHYSTRGKLPRPRPTKPALSLEFNRGGFWAKPKVGPNSKHKTRTLSQNGCVHRFCSAPMPDGSRAPHQQQRTQAHRKQTINEGTMHLASTSLKINQSFPAKRINQQPPTPRCTVLLKAVIASQGS